MTTIATINGNDNVGESRVDINQNFSNLNTDKVEGGTNLGAGEAVFTSKSGVNLQFKSFVAGSNVTLSSDGTSITISSSGGGGGIPEAPNDGSLYARQSESWTALGTAALAATGDFATAAQGSLANTALQPSYISAGANVSFSGAGTSGDPIVISASGGGAGSLDDLSDVTITTPTNGQGFYYNGTNFVNGVVPVSGGGTGAATHTTNAVMVGNGTSALRSSGVQVTTDNEISGFRGNINKQTGTTYTVQASDAGRIVECSNGSDITVELPNSLPQGFTVTFVQTNEGQIIFDPASGADLHNRSRHDRTAGEWAAVTLYVSANTGSEAQWVIAGDTSE